MHLFVKNFLKNHYPVTNFFTIFKNLFAFTTPCDIIRLDSIDLQYIKQNLLNHIKFYTGTKKPWQREEEEQKRVKKLI